MSDPLVARIRNLFTTGRLSRRDGDAIQGTTRHGRTVEGCEHQPYGFAARAKEGTVLFLFENGDVRSPTMLYVSSQEGVPELEDGDAALWTQDGGWIVARNSGVIEINGNDFGGIVKVAELRAQLVKSSQMLSSIQSVLVTPIFEPGGGAPSAFQAALATALLGQSPGEFSQIENAKVLHGSGGV